MNKKGSILAGFAIAAGIIIGMILITALVVAGMYNGLIQKDVSSEKAWANVQTAYERRLDLIPNLVATVKGAASFERDTQTEIAGLRSGIRDAKNAGEMQEVEGRINSLVSDLIVSVEAYPQLRATDNFRALQDELAGTENRIKWERDNFNEKVQEYKVAVRTFPTNIIAGMFGFTQDKWDMFEAEKAASKPVNVSFD